MNGTGVKLREEGDKLILDGSGVTLEDYEIEWLQSLPHDAALCELLEHCLCNGWEEVEVALFGGMVLRHPYLDIYYADTQWAVKNAVETLLQGGLYYFYKIDIETHKNTEIL